MDNWQICISGQNCTIIFLHIDALYKKLDLNKEKKKEQVKIKCQSDNSCAKHWGLRQLKKNR